MTTTQPWTFRVHSVIRVIDGDTLWLKLDKGHRLYHDVAVRLLGIDAPERQLTTRAAGDHSKAWVTAFLLKYPPLKLQSDVLDEYSRSLGDVLTFGGWLVEAMITAGVAIPYVEKRRPWTAEELARCLAAPLPGA